MTIRPYIFWILGWGVTPVYTNIKFLPVNIRCEIDQTAFVLFTPKKEIRIPLSQITNVEQYRFARQRGAGGSTNLLLELVDSSETREQISHTGKIYILPVCVFENPPTHSFSEIATMVEVIEALRANRQPFAHPNPYYRALQKRDKLVDFSEEKWDALTPPHIYTPPMNIGKFVITMIGIVIGATLLFMIIAGLIFNLFFRG